VSILKRGLTGFDLRVVLVLIAAVSVVVGLALVYIPASLVVPGVAILVLGYARGWY